MELKKIYKDSPELETIKDDIYILLDESYRDVKTILSQNFGDYIQYESYVLPYRSSDDMLDKVTEYKLVYSDDLLYAVATYENNVCTLIGSDTFFDKNKDAVKMLIKDDFNMEHLYYFPICDIFIDIINKKFKDTCIKLSFPYIHIILDDIAKYSFNNNFGFVELPKNMLSYGLSEKVLFITSSIDNVNKVIEEIGNDGVNNIFILYKQNKEKYTNSVEYVYNILNDIYSCAWNEDHLYQTEPEIVSYLLYHILQQAKDILQDSNICFSNYNFSRTSFKTVYNDVSSIYYNMATIKINKFY